MTPTSRLDVAGRHRRPSRLLAGSLVLMQVAIVVVALSLPLSFAWIRRQAERLGLQVSTRESTTIAVHDRLSIEPALLVLSFHNVERHPHSLHSTTPRAFADDMHALTAAGYTSASAADVDAALAGHPPSGHKVLITFDDGAKGIWTYADPILSRYRMHAMAFIVSGDVGTHQPYYVTWPELRAMHRSGRWDLESHTYLGHGLIASSSLGGKGAFLATRQWLPALHRYETLAEYQARIRGDFTESKIDMIAHGLPSPRFFAFPFSATGYRSNDPPVPLLLRKIVREQFAVAFDNKDDASAISTRDVAARLLPRIEVTGQTSPLALLARLRRASPLTLGEADLRRPTDWCCSTKVPNVAVGPHGSLRLLGAKPSGWRLSTYQPSRVANWPSYTFSATGHALTSTNAAAALLVRDNATAAIRVIVTRTRARVGLVRPTGGATELARHDLPLADTHRIRITVTPSGTSVAVDGRLIAQRGPGVGPSTGGIGLGVYITASEAEPWFDDLVIAPAFR